MQQYFFSIYFFVLSLQLSFACWSEIVADPLTLTMQDIIERALQVSFDVANSKLDSQIQSMQQAKNWAQVSPSVSVSWNYSQYDAAIPFIDDDGQQRIGKDGQPLFIRPLSSSTGSVLITQPLTGLIGALAQAHVDGIHRFRSRLELEETKVNVSFAAAMSYRQMQQAQAVFNIAEDRVALAEKQKQEATLIFKLGRLSKSDFLRLDVLVSQAKVSATYAKAYFENTRSQLLSLLDYQDDQVFKFEKISDPKYVDLEVKVPELLQARDEAVAERLNLKMARFSQKEVEKSSRLPLLSLVPNVNAFVRFDHNFLQAGLFALPSTQLAGFTLDWPIWDGGSRFISHRSLQLQSYKVKNKVAFLERSLSLEVMKARLDLIAAQDVFNLQKLLVLQNEEIYRGMYERFLLGSLPVTDLLQTENTLNTSRVDFMKALSDLDIKNMLLQKAMGNKRPVSIL